MIALTFARELSYDHRRPQRTAGHSALRPRRHPASSRTGSSITSCSSSRWSCSRWHSASRARASGARCWRSARTNPPHAPAPSTWSRSRRAASPSAPRWRARPAASMSTISASPIRRPFGLDATIAQLTALTLGGPPVAVGRLCRLRHRRGTAGRDRLDRRLVGNAGGGGLAVSHLRACCSSASCWCRRTSTAAASLALIRTRGRVARAGSGIAAVMTDALLDVDRPVGAVRRLAGGGRCLVRGRPQPRSSASLAPTAPARRRSSTRCAASCAPPRGARCFAGSDMTGLAPERVARLGIARTFQNVRLFGELSLRENVMMGAYRAGQLRRVRLDAAPGRPRQARARGGRSSADRWLERLGLGAYAETPATALPFGLQRVAEIARAMASEPTLVLLDEPAAGLNEVEKQQLSSILRDIVRRDRVRAAPGRAQHAAGDGAGRSRRRARFRAQDRRRPARRRWSRSPAVVEAYLGV